MQKGKGNEAHYITTQLIKWRKRQQRNYFQIIYAAISNLECFEIHCATVRLFVMLNIFKKEEQSESMTEPLLSRSVDEGLGFVSNGTESPGFLGYNNVGFSGNLGHQNGQLFYNIDGTLPEPDIACMNPNGNIPNGYRTIDDIFPNENAENSCYAPEPPTFEIIYEKFPEKVNKVQASNRVSVTGRRQGGKSEQRLKADEAQVVLGIDINGVAQVADVQVFVVKVMDQFYHTSDDRIDPQRLVTNVTQYDGRYRVKIDLDSVYEVEVPHPADRNATKRVKVYKLAKNKTDKANLFKLKVVVVYVDGSFRELYTDKSFIIIGRERRSADIPEPNERESHTLPPPAIHGKRPRTATDESYSSAASTEDIRLASMNPQSNMSDNSSLGYATDSSMNDGILNAYNLVAEKIKASKADIGELIVAKPVQVQGCDIAYNFILKNPDAHPNFVEGEIVGLFVNENGERVLDKLSPQNSVHALVKGVITRSFYIEANIQPDGVRTEKICMFGIVPVRLRGSVVQGEIVYASSEHPGLAVARSSSVYKSKLKNDAAAIGMAWETAQYGNDEINLVSCFVSITMEIFHGFVKRDVSRIENKIDSEIEAIKKQRMKSRRRKIIGSIALACFITLLSILLWQLFMPGSAFRYYKCEEDSIKGHTCKFRFIPIGDIFSFYWVTGYEFTFPALWKKLKDKYNMSIPKINATGYHYYFNVDRCAYGQIVKTTDSFVNKKRIGGPLIFAVDDHCQHAWYYSETFKSWCTYRSAKHLTCNPPHNDHKHIHGTYVHYCK
eukprot:gene17329-19062_t